MDLSGHTILTTNRPQDKVFVNFALMKGLEFKVYNIRDYLTEDIIKKVAHNIDYLLIYSDMSSYFFRTLFGFCDSVVYVNGEKMEFETYKKLLRLEYENTINKKIGDFDNPKSKISTVDIYKEEILAKLRKIEKVTIKVKDLLSV